MHLESRCIYVYVYVYVHTYVCVHIHIYIYINRIDDSQTAASMPRALQASAGFRKS